MTSSSHASSGGARSAIVLGVPRDGGPARYVLHVAVGRWTLCGVELAGTTVPDPPDLELDAVQDCGHFLCQRFVAEVKAAEGVLV